MSLPPHVYPCVVQRLLSSTECHPSYGAGCALYDSGQHEKARAAFVEALKSLSASLPLPAAARATITSLSPPSPLSPVDKPADERKDQQQQRPPPLSSVQSLSSSQPIHRTVAQLRESQSPGSSASSSDDSALDPASPLSPRIHLETADESQSSCSPQTRPISVSHVQADWSQLSSSDRLLLAHYHNAVACCCSLLGFYRDGKQHLYAAIDLLPSCSLYLFNLGCAHLSHKRWETAVKAFRMAVKREDGNASYHSNLAVSLLMARENNKALASFAKVVEMTADAAGGAAEAYANLAVGCMVGKKKWKEAVSYLRKAVEVEERSREAMVAAGAGEQAERSVAMLHCQLALCYLELSSLPSALYHASIALAVLPHLPHGHRHRAFAWAALGSPVLALADGQNALRLWSEVASEADAAAWRRERYEDELRRAMDDWRQALGARDEDGEKAALVAALSRLQLSAHIPVAQHDAVVDELRAQLKQAQHALAEAQLSRTPTVAAAAAPTVTAAASSSPPTPRTAQKQERILCVVCLDAPRCQLFEPCKHLLCCEACGSLVRACPFCKVVIKKRRGPIFM